MNKKVISIIINILIVIFATFATICMFTNFHFMGDVPTLSSEGVACFKYFTVDSNILMGIASLVFTVYGILVLKKKIKKMPKWLYVFKHVATTAVAMTFFTTLLYLAPQFDRGFFTLYTNANLFFHLIVPVLAMVDYIVLNKYDNKYKYCIYTLIPYILYSFYYVPNVLLHIENGVVSNTYDFYGFFHGNPNTIYVFYPIILIVVYTIATILYWLNKNFLKK